MSLSKPRMKRNELSLKKVELIKKANDNPSFGVRKLADMFECGRTQVSGILKDKAKYLDLYESNASSKLVRKKERTVRYGDVNKALYKWYLLAVSKNVCPDGPQLAKEIASRMDVHEFKGSNRWLEKWKLWYNIRQISISGKSGDVSGDTFTSWKECSSEILSGCSKINTWNLNETGCFWKVLPTKGFKQKAQQCKCGKKSKQRVTVVYNVNAAGEKEKPVFIWKSENHPCFKHLKKDLLIITLRARLGWRTILHDVLQKILKRSQQSVLLLMDNAGCHPENIRGKFSNIKVVFLPANTTSMLQPLDLWIIKNFKVYYRKLPLSFVSTKIEECTNATEIMKSVTVLHALR